MSHSKTRSYRLLALVTLLSAAALAQEPQTKPATPATPATSPTASATAEAAATPAAAPTAAAPAPADKPEPTYSKKGADTCLGCHDDEVTLAVFHGKHGQPTDDRSPFGKGQLQCEACHGPAGDHTKRVKKGQTRPPVIRFGRDSAAPVAVQNGMCLTCHEDAMAADWHAGPHDAASVPCAACHDSHARKDAVLATRTQADVCYTCHTAERTEFTKPFAHPVRQGQLACSDCHAPHGTTAEFQLVRATLNQTCYECHAEKRGPFLWEHSPVAEDCSTCHAPHGASNPGMLKARGPLLCQSCHSQQGHPSYAYGPSALPGNTTSPATALALGNCMNCHSQVHGSNHPSGATLSR
jgi:DmsE family decaheme c-type cytochrome